MNGSLLKQSARDRLAGAHPDLIGLSHSIHANPELGYEETLAAGLVAGRLETAGFDVRRGIGGMDTAISGGYGPGPFHVVICAEYDALPVVGHACGHNVIAAAAVGAAMALAAVTDQLGLRVTLLGTPAEEGGGGKIRLIQAGAFGGVHAALMVHPGAEDVAEPSIIAAQQLEIAYMGREAHAAAYPEEGINAADAIVIAQAAIGLLRQQLQTGDRVHGIVTSGGEAPNIIPAHTSARFMTRAATRERLTELTARVRRCFEAGALATGAELSFEEGVAYAQMSHDQDLVALYVRNAEGLGRRFEAGATLTISTDMGDVSHVVPSIHPIIGIASRPAVNHQPGFTAAAASAAADQAIFDGALALAWTVIDAAQDPALRERLTEDTWHSPVAPAVGRSETIRSGQV
jgi:amidohydrolase